MALAFCLALAWLLALPLVIDGLGLVAVACLVAVSSIDGL